ncbi:MAG: CARDB domain-containing protein [Methanothrix sp.]
MSSDKNILLYGGIAIIVVIAVFIAIVVSFQPSGPYKIDVSINALNYNPSATYLFNTTYFNITISNTGSAPVHGMQVGFYLDDQAIKYYNVSIPAHKSANIRENYTYSQNGTYNFSVVADPSRILNIANSSVTSAQVSINVSNPQQPNLYQYIPSNNTNETYTFTLFPRGMEFSSLMDIEYNISQFKPLLGPDTGISFNIMHDLSPLLNLGNGVYSRYANDTVVYGLWLEGTMNNADIKSLLSTYSFPEHSFNKGNSSAIFAKLNYTTSFCSYSSKGWTKIFIYYNATEGGNCESMLGSKYNDTEYALLSNATSSHSAEYAKDANFTYQNSTSEGFAISLIGKNYSIYRLSEDGSAGNFASIMGFHNALNVSAYHRVCPGYIYVNNSTGLSMCTEYFKSPLTALQNYSLSDSISISKNYTLQLYSFVRLNYSEAALFNAASLFTKLNLTNQYTSWDPLDNNTCSFANSSIGCKYESFNSTSKKYSLNISNGFSSPIKINSIGCSLYLPVNATTPVNETLAPGKSIIVSLACKLPPVPISSTVSTYFMNMSYSMAGKQMYENGTITYGDFYVS